MTPCRRSLQGKPRHRRTQGRRYRVARDRLLASELAKQSCQSCTALLDQLDPAAKHFAAAHRRFTVVADTSPKIPAETARDRGWRHLELLSSKGTTFTKNHGDDGQQKPMMLSFQRDPQGTVRLDLSSDMVDSPSDPGQNHRATGTVDTFLNLLDLSPGGRPDVQERLCTAVVTRQVEFTP